MIRLGLRLALSGGSGAAIGLTLTAFAVAVGIDRKTGGGQPQCGADAEGRHEGAERDGPVPAGPPAGVVHLAAVFEGHGAEDEGNEDQQQRQVERGEQ